MSSARKVYGLALLSGFALAIAAAVAGGAHGQAAPPALAYQASVSDLMLTIIQPRHRNLWLARQAGNWDYAAYEAGNLAGAFGRLGRAHPAIGDIPLQDMIASVTTQPLQDLAAAAKAHDAAAFDKAYSDLTDGCNACHEGTNHSVVVIRVPSTDATVDQDFRPTAH